MNTQIIAIANQKGGVGKTTTCANLGIGLAQAGKKVLLIDGDPQGSLTISLGHPQPDKLPFTLSDAMGRILMDEPLRPGEGILHHPEGVDLMPADIQLSGMEVSLVNAMSRETILRQYLDTLKGQYSHIVGDICAGQYVNPEDDDQSVLGSKIDIMNVWQHISTVFIDALRDVESELRKPKNPIRQIIDTIEGNIEETDIDDIKRKISELNQKISHIPQVSDIGSQVNQKLLEMIGAIYSPEIKLESRLKEDFATLARYLTISPSNQKDIDLLGLGHHWL